MAKGVAFLCMALLVVVAQVAHVQSARLLKQYDAGITAETYPSHDAPTDDEVFAERTDVADPSDTVYNYDSPATVQTSTDEGMYAPEGILQADTPPTEPYVFDALHDDATTTQDFNDPLDAQMADLDGVQSGDHSPTHGPEDAFTSFQFQENPSSDDDGSQGGYSGSFIYDDSVNPSFGN